MSYTALVMLRDSASDTWDAWLEYGVWKTQINRSADHGLQHESGLESRPLDFHSSLHSLEKWTAGASPYCIVHKLLLSFSGADLVRILYCTETIEIHVHLQTMTRKCTFQHCFTKLVQQSSRVCKKGLSFQQLQAISYLSFRWVLLYAWTVNSVNWLFKNP